MVLRNKIFSVAWCPLCDVFSFNCEVVKVSFLVLNTLNINVSYNIKYSIIYPGSSPVNIHCLGKCFDPLMIFFSFFMTSIPKLCESFLARMFGLYTNIESLYRHYTNTHRLSWGLFTN